MVIRPLFYVDFSLLDTYNREFGFDKYNKKTHKGVPQHQYIPYADIQAEYIAPWLCIWPPQSEYAIIDLNERNKLDYFAKVSPRDKLKKDIDNQDKISRKIAIEKNEKKIDKLKEQQAKTRIKYDKRITDLTQKKDEEQKKLKALNTELDKETKERTRLDNLRNTLVSSHSIYMCNDLFGAYSNSSFSGTTNHNLVAGFARTRDYDCCLFNPAIRSTRHDLFCHELGRNFGLGEISNDLDISIADSKENFMDYRITRRSFHYWQWRHCPKYCGIAMLSNLLTKQRRIQNLNNRP